MDLNELRCNHLKCRKILSLEGKGVSTSCSHVFCVACANTLFTPERLCPACETHLPHDDDMLYFSLNPSTEFRNTVLAGLSPSIIVDIVSRALNFWTYQQGQEKIFQEMLLKHSQEHATILEQDNLNITQRANQELDRLRNRLDDAQRELDMTRQQQRDLQTTLRGSQRQQHSLQSKYDRMRASIGPRANPDLLATSSGTSPAAGHTFELTHSRRSSIEHEQTHRPTPYRVHEKPIQETHIERMPLQSHSRLTNIAMPATSKASHRFNWQAPKLAEEPKTSKRFARPMPTHSNTRML